MRSGANEWASDASERVSGRASGRILTSRFKEFSITVLCRSEVSYVTIVLFVLFSVKGYQGWTKQNLETAHASGTDGVIIFINSHLQMLNPMANFGISIIEDVIDHDRRDRLE